MTMQSYRTWARTVLLATLVLGAGARAAHAHGDVMRIGSSQAGGGQLRIEPEFDFDLDVVLSPTSSAGDFTLYNSIFPSFTWVLEPAEGLFPLGASVLVRFTLVEPITSAHVRIDGRLLDTANETATIGSFDPDPESHVHPEWQLVLPTGTTGEFRLRFMLTTTAAGYTQSPVYELLLTNVASAPSATPSPTPTATEAITATPTALDEATAMPTPDAPATATASGTPDLTPTGTHTGAPTATATEIATAPATSSPSHTATTPETTATDTPEATATVPPAACAGDCNGDGAVTIDELIRAVGLAGSGTAASCAAVDGNGDNTVSIDELVRAVRAALDGCETSPATGERNV